MQKNKEIAISRGIKRLLTSGMKIIIHKNVPADSSEMSDTYYTASLKYGESILNLIKSIFNYAYEHKDEFYCGRCVKFFKMFDVYQGRLLYCKECSEGILKTTILIDGTIQREKQESYIARGQKNIYIAREKTNHTIEQPDTLQLSMKDSIEKWLSTNNTEFLFDIIRKYIEETEIAYIEIVSTTHELQILEQIAKNWIVINSRYYIIYINKLQKELTDEELELIGSFAIDFRYTNRKNFYSKNS